MSRSILREPSVTEFAEDIHKLFLLRPEEVLETGVCGDIVLVRSSKGKRNGRLVMKTFSLTNLETRARSERNFIREATFMQSLDHEYIVKCFRAAKCSDFLSITMKYYRGRSLNFYVGECGLDMIERWVVQLGCALRYLHNNNLVHLDVKLDNVFMDESYNAILADFGLAMEVGPDKETLSKKNIGGTPGYVAPECTIVPGDIEVNPYKLDAFNLGVVFWSLVFEQAPGSDVDYVMETKRKRDLKPQVRDMLLGLLNPDPKLRFTVADFLSKARRDTAYRYIIDSCYNRWYFVTEKFDFLNRRMGFANRRMGFLNFMSGF